jgi:hypothetical protein
VGDGISEGGFAVGFHARAAVVADIAMEYFLPCIAQMLGEVAQASFGAEVHRPAEARAERCDRLANK